MKSLIVTTKQLKELGLMNLEPQLKARITKFEKKNIGGGFVVVTSNKAISETGVFQLDNLNALSAIASCLACTNDELTSSDIRKFVNALNTTADLDKSYLVITYHKTVKDLAFKATQELTAMFSDVKLDEEVIITEGYVNRETGEALPFKGTTRTNSQSFELSTTASDKLDKYQESIDVAIKLAIRAEKATAVKPSVTDDKPANMFRKALDNKAEDETPVETDDDVVIGAETPVETPVVVDEEVIA